MGRYAIFNGLVYGGGTNVIPNPEGTPTDTLNTIGIDGVVYDIEGGSEGEGVEIYSENEYIVGKWVDGKKLYQKTIYYTHNDTIGDGYTTIASLSDADYFEFVECSLYNPTDKRSYALSYAYGSKTTALTYDNGDIKLRVNSDTWNANWDVVITVRYTKTVETPAPAWGGSVNNYYANFIDTDNVIQAHTVLDSASVDYVATEDCFVVVLVNGASGTAPLVLLDGVTVGGGWSQQIIGRQILVPAKKGQTVTMKGTLSSDYGSYEVYGISYGSGGSSSGSKIEYSTDEKEVGTWLDGSSIYQKTFVLSSPVVLTSGDWTVISEVNIPNADASIYTEVFYSSPKIQLTAAGRFDNGALSIFLPFTFRTDKVTVRYTKTTT